MQILKLQKRVVLAISFISLKTYRGKRGIRKKSDAKSENIAHIHNKYTLIMAKVIASEIKGKHWYFVKSLPSEEKYTFCILA